MESIEQSKTSKVRQKTKESKNKHSQTCWKWKLPKFSDHLTPVNHTDAESSLLAPEVPPMAVVSKA